MRAETKSGRIACKQGSTNTEYAAARTAFEEPLKPRMTSVASTTARQSCFDEEREEEDDGDCDAPVSVGGVVSIGHV